jgi:phosphotransacetylase
MSTSTPFAAGSAHKLSELIYVELVGRAFLRADNSVTFKPNPEQLAKLSLQLAEVFQQAEKARLAELGPKNVGYDVQSADIGNWQK